MSLLIKQEAISPPHPTIIRIKNFETTINNEHVTVVNRSLTDDRLLPKQNYVDEKIINLHSKAPQND
jgi:hypothetical protein